MNFYTINYIQNHQNTDRTALYILMIVAASAMIIFTILYLRDRFNTRYRDLGIIALLFLLLFTGTQYEKYVQIGKQKLTNYTRYVKFESIENVTENEVNSSIKI